MLTLAMPAFAVGDPETDWCGQLNDACQASCDSYNIHVMGFSLPSPRSAMCALECGIAYAGCVMFRFHSGT